MNYERIFQPRPFLMNNPYSSFSFQMPNMNELMMNDFANRSHLAVPGHLSQNDSQNFLNLSSNTTLDNKIKQIADNNYRQNTRLELKKGFLDSVNNQFLDSFRTPRAQMPIIVGTNNLINQKSKVSAFPNDLLSHKEMTPSTKLPSPEQNEKKIIKSEEKPRKIIKHIIVKKEDRKQENKDTNVNEEKPNLTTVNKAYFKNTEKLRNKVKTSKLVGELNQGLQHFQLEFAKEINNLKFAQDKINVTELSSELDSLKINHQKNLEKSNLKRGIEFQKFIEGMKTLKNDLAEKIVKNQEKSQVNILSISEEFRTMKRSVEERINKIEINQKNQLERIKNLVDKSQGKKKISFLLTNDKEKLTQVKDNYLKHTDVELNSVLEELKRNNKKRGSIESIDKFMKIRKNDNNQIKDDHRYQIELNKKILETRDYFERIKINLINNERINSDLAQKVAQQSKKLKSNIKVNHLRKWFIAFCAIKRFSYMVRENKLYLRENAINYFEKRYLSVEKEAKTWLMSSIHPTYSSILSNEELDLDMIEDEMNSEEKFFKLETRLNSLMENLINNTSLEKIDINFVNFIQIITSEYSQIPYNYFTYFERTRIEYTNDYCFKNLTEDHKKMIIGFFVIIKTFLKGVIVDTLSRSTYMSQISKNNLKIIGSVIYRTVLDIFTNMIKQNPESIQICMNNKPQFKTLNVEIPKINKKNDKLDKNFFESYKNFSKKKNLEQNKNHEIFDNSYLKLFNIFSKRETDSMNNEVEYLEEYFYSKGELKRFYDISMENSFDMRDSILTWIDKFYGIVYLKK